MEINIKEMVRKVVKDVTKEEFDKNREDKEAWRKKKGDKEQENEDKKVLKFPNEETILFEAGDIIQTLLDFLGTEMFEKMFSSIDKSSEKAVFQAGLMLVPSILMAKCNKNYAVPAHKNNQEEEYEPKAIPDFEFGDDYKDWYCGYCGEHIDPEYDFYCSQCGKKIKMPEEKKDD